MGRDEQQLPPVYVIHVTRKNVKRTYAGAEGRR